MVGEEESMTNRFDVQNKKRKEVYPVIVQYQQTERKYTIKWQEMDVV